MRRKGGTVRAVHAACILLAAALCHFASRVANAQSSYGRTAATGDWGDGFWVNASGVTGGVPTSGDTALIGFLGNPHASAIANATVNVSGNRAAETVNVAGSGVLNLNSGTLTAGTLSISQGGMINRTSGVYDVNALDLRNGVSLNYMGSDVLDDGIFLGSNANFTLQKDLTLANGLSLDNATLNFNGHLATVRSFTRTGNATLNRGMGGHIQSEFFNFAGGSPFVIDGVDNFTGAGTLSAGASVSNTVPLNLAGALQLFGSGTSYTATAPLSMGGVFTVGAGSTFTADAQITFTGPSNVDYGITGVLNANAPLTGNGNLRVVGAGATLNVNDDITLDGFVSTTSSGTINLNSGTLDANALSAATGAIINVQNNVELTGNMNIGGLGTVNVLQSLGDGTGFTVLGNTVSISPLSSLNLTFDSGEGPGPIDFAFRWAGNHVAALTPLLGTQITATGAPKPVSIIYDPAKYDDFTYIAFIPTLLGDLNGDGDFTPADYLILSTNLLTNVSGMAALDSYFLGDLNGDRKINGADYVTFRTNYDLVNGAGAFEAIVQSVPEPSSIYLATMICAILYWRRPSVAGGR